MKVYKIADYLSNKYNLSIYGADKPPALPLSKPKKQRIPVPRNTKNPDITLYEVKQALLDAWNNYCNIDKVKDKWNIIALLAQADEKNSKQIISLMKDVVNDLKKTNGDAIVDKLDNKPAYLLLTQVNSVLAVIDELQQDNSKKIRTIIHDSFVIKKESDKNRREMAKSKWEQVVNHKLSNVLNTQATILKTLVGSTEEIMGGSVEPQRRELSKDKLLMFMHTPAAQQYGFDSLDVLQKLLDYNETRQLLTTLINAIDRGHIPADGPTINAETKKIHEIFNQRKTNENYFETDEDTAELLNTEILDPQESWVEKMKKSKEEKALERKEQLLADEEEERMKPLIEQRDKEHSEREIQKDRERHVRKESFLLRKQLLRRYL